MGFMDELRKLTTPYDDDDDFFEGSDESLKEPAQPSSAQIQFENAFAADPAGKPEPAERKPVKEAGEGGRFGLRRQPKAKSVQRERVVDFGGSETKVILFSPKTFEESGELVDHLMQGRSVVMTLDGIPTDTARRLLDFISGITYALQGKITPISAKAYFVSPQNVDILSAQSQSQPNQPETGGQYF